MSISSFSNKSKIDEHVKQFIEHLLLKIQNISTIEEIDKSIYHSKKVNLFLRNMNCKVCCAPDYNNCKGSIIKSHSIQKSKSIKNISESRHVLTFHKQISDIPNLVGINDISTENMFCEFHDREIFKLIDTQNIHPTNEQSILLSIRTLAAELHKKVMLYKIKLLADSGLSLYDVSFHYLSMFSILKRRKYEKLERCIIKIEEIPEIMTSTCYIPEMDFYGTEIQHINTLCSNLLTFEVFSDGTHGLVTMEWLKTDAKCKIFVNSLLNQNDIPNTIVKFIAAFCENSAFKPSWWNSLSVSKKSQLIKYQRLNIEAVSYTQIFDEFSKDTRQYVKWTIKKIQKSF